MRSYSQDYAVMAQVVQKMCLLRCADIRFVQSSVSTAFKELL